MARRYSNLYNTVVNRGTAAGAVVNTTGFIYAGPHPDTRGEVSTIVATYNLANGTLNVSTTDDLVIAFIPGGSRISRIVIGSSGADVDTDNNFTFDLGFLGGTLNAILNDSNVLQAGADTTFTPEEVVVPAAGADLILTSAAGELNSTGTLSFVIDVVYP